LNEDIVGLAEGDEFGLREVWVKLYLVDGWFDFADGEEVFEFRDGPVGDSDGFGFAFGVDLDQGGKGRGRGRRKESQRRLGSRDDDPILVRI